MTDAPTPEPTRVTLFGYDGEAMEIAETAKAEPARRLARIGTKKPGVAYATVVTGSRLDVFARGRNRLRIKNPFSV
jgi:hypothetical protein